MGNPSIIGYLVIQLFSS